jgi:hypothetical protein
MLEGEILFREGNEECYAHLRKAVELDDGLNYMVSSTRLSFLFVIERLY